MAASWLAFVGILLFFALGLGWRSWHQRRRYGSSGILLFQSGDFRQDIRDALGVALAVSLIGQAGVMTLGWRHPSSSPAVMLVIGTLLLYGGTVLLVVAQLHLGSSWRVGVKSDAKPGLVTSGFYRFSRNPIYFAMLLALAGYGLLLPTWLSLGSLVGTYFGIRRQVAAEEAYLLRTYGDDFRVYARRVGRFVPGVGRL